MKNIQRLIHVFVLSCAFLMATNVWAQNNVGSSLEAGSINTLVYSVAPDYRRCVFPLCGGYWLTPVNRVSTHVPSLDEADAGVIIEPSPIYVASIEFAKLGLSSAQITEFKGLIGEGRALVSGVLSDFEWAYNTFDVQMLTATGVWGSANNNAPVGSFLEVSSSGIVCITTPCPYYNAQQINTFYSFLFHELNFDRAELTSSQLLLAQSLVSKKSLILTGTRFVSQGVAGNGVGIAATQVFFPFPSKVLY